MKRRWIAALLTLALGPSIALAETGRPDPVRVVTTVGMIRDVVANVGGDCVAVDALMGPGVDPHLYRASAGDVRKLRNADVIFYGGYSLEGKLGSVLDRLRKNIQTVAVSEATYEPDTLLEGGEDYAIDPHLWMDVELWAGTIGTIADALIEQQPACEGTVRNNAEHYRQQLTALDGWIREAIGTIPEDHRYLVTAHDAFGYYGRSYDIQVVGIQGISTASAAGVGDIRATAAKIVDTGVPAIFIESTINPRTIQSVVEAAQQRGHQVEVGGELYSDAMGAQGTAEGTYIGMLHANTRTVVTALGGQTPPLPAALEDWAKEWGL